MYKADQTKHIKKTSYMYKDMSTPPAPCRHGRAETKLNIGQVPKPNYLHILLNGQTVQNK